MEVDVLVRFSPDTVGAIADAAGRRYLTETGLPEEHRLCRARPPAVTVTTPSGVGAVVLGETDGGTLCVNTATGVVFALGDYGDAEWHINASIEQFGESLAVFDRQYPFYGRDPDRNTLKAAAKVFEAAVSAVDATAMSTPHSLWINIYMEISNGDYGEWALVADKLQ